LFTETSDQLPLESESSVEGYTVTEKDIDREGDDEKGRMNGREGRDEY
jgi:hypothetical protein